METTFNFENLTPIELGRIKKLLDKKYRYSEGVMTQKEYIKKYAVGKKIHKGGIFNRKHYNRLDYEGQVKYEANLNKKVSYEITLKDGCSIDIPKIIYNTLEFKEIDNLKNQDIYCSECDELMDDMCHNYGTENIHVCIHCYNDAQL